MITDFNKKNRASDIKILKAIIICFFVSLWLCTPPGNKFAQLCFYGNNTQFLVAKLTKSNEELEEWKFHRNNAIYLARMERKYSSLKEMDAAIKTIPNYINEAEIEKLYAERAQLRLYLKEYRGALDDFLRVSNPNFTQRFKIAMLFKRIGNNKQALSYCNSVLNLDSYAYMGYFCVADVYSAAGRPDISVKVFDILIDKHKNRARYYADRANYKKLAGDEFGYNEDLLKAKSLLPTVELESNLLEEMLNPKKLSLTIL